MELSSVLLTKKAALIGGGAAATTTAVTVPIVVTQKKESESDATSSDPNKAKPGEAGSERTEDLPQGDDPAADDSGSAQNSKIDLNLSIKDSSYFVSFNKPGDCIKKLFPGVENKKNDTNDNKRGVFHKPNSVSDKTAPQASYGAVDVGSGNSSVTPPESACLMYNKRKGDDNREFRIELALKKGKWGWIWMSGLKKKGQESKYDYYIRELVVKTDSENGTDWIGYGGLDSKYEHNGNDITPTFDTNHFPELQTRDVSECDESSKNNCIEKESKVAVWSPKDDGKTFLPTDATGLSKAILALGGNRDYDQGGNSKRQSIYGDSGWFPNISGQGNMITFNKTTIFGDSAKGEWKDLVTYCEDTSKSSESTYTTFCSTPN